MGDFKIKDGIGAAEKVTDGADFRAQSTELRETLTSNTLSLVSCIAVLNFHEILLILLRLVFLVLFPFIIVYK